MTSQRLSLLVSFVVGLLVAPTAWADVKLPSLFSDHLVLQRDAAVPVWGWADPGEEVTVTIAAQSKKTAADKQGKWSVKLAPLTTGEPQTLTVQGKNTLTVKDVLVGEVWLASGQSNMAMQVSRCNDFEKEQTAADLPKVRMFTVRSGQATKPQSECEGSWAVCSPTTVGNFSGTAYFFGRELHKQLGVPIGIVNSSVGGTAIEAWTSSEAMDGVRELAPIYKTWEQRAAVYDPVKAKAKYETDLAAWKVEAEQAKKDNKPLPRRPQVPVEPREDRNYPANLFNGKIAPLVPFAIRGAIWYQGEANTRAETASIYGRQLELLIRDWRSRWGQGDFPFAWVQLPNYGAPGRNWPIVREGMQQTLRVPNTGMAITLDIGDPKDIHPTNKQDVGKRLALWALARVYDKSVPYSGPLVKKHEASEGTIRIHFDHADGGLTTRGDELKGFEIAGEDRKWHAAKAVVEGKNTVVVSSSAVKKPVAVRYAWENNPVASLFNGAGLPASPFRTEAWE